MQIGRDPVILDGGLATELERRGAELSDRLWSAALLIDDPEAIRQAHLAYFRAGAQVAITATYQASVEGFASRGIQTAQAEDLMRRAVRLARSARDEAGSADDRVAASLGPYGAFLADGSEYTGAYGETTEADLVGFHRSRVDVLADAGAELFAVETIPSLAEISALARVLGEVPEVPAWVSFSCRDGATISDGTPIETAAAVAASIPSVVAVGVNCTPTRFISQLITRLRSSVPTPVVVYPNAGGRWDAQSRTWVGEGRSVPTDLADASNAWLDAGALMIGGCCGFGSDAIDALARSMRS